MARKGAPLARDTGEPLHLAGGEGGSIPSARRRSAALHRGEPSSAARRFRIGKTAGILPTSPRRRRLRRRMLGRAGRSCAVL